MEKYAIAHRQKRKWMAAVICLSVAVVLCTIYLLVLPAITLEKNQVLDCAYTIHKHDSDCYDKNGELSCGYADYAVHTHQKDSCYDSDGKLVCQLKEVKEHKHTDDCYDGKKDLTCGKEEVILHTHSKECYDKNGGLACDQLEVLEHKHENGCFVPVDNSDAETLHEETESTDTLLVAPYGAVVSAWAKVDEQKTAIHNKAPRRAPAATSADETPTDLTPYLTEAKIQVGGKDYQPGEKLDKEASFDVVLGSAISNNELSYQYKLPDQIKVKDTGSAEIPLTLFAGNTKIGSYYIKNNTVYINYVQSYTDVTTELKLSAHWNENVGNNETINWGNGSSTEVEFMTKDIIIQKTDSNNGVMQTGDDGELYIEYTIQAMLDEGGTLKIQDTMSDDRDGITKLWKKAYNNGTADYEITIRKNEDNEGGETRYGNFSGDSTNSFSIKDIQLEKGQYVEIKYKVRVDEADRTNLELGQKKLTVENKATAEGTVDNTPLTADVTHNVTYQAPKSWIQKTAMNTSGDSNADDTWKITINGQNKYDVEGTVVADYLTGNGTTYKTGAGDFTVTIAGQDGKSSQQTLQVIDISNWKSGNLTADDFENFVCDTLANCKIIAEMDAAISKQQSVFQELLHTKETVNVAMLSRYVFVDNSDRKKTVTGDTGSLFLWIAPPNDAVQGAGEAPYSYTLDYSTHSDEGTPAVINQAAAKWQGYPVGTGPITTVKQQIGIDKSNSGVYAGEDGNLYVDWTINLTVPKNSAALQDIWLTDSLPEANVKVSKQDYKTYPSLVGLSNGTLDGDFLVKHKEKFTNNQSFDKKTELMEYLHELVGDAFTFTWDGDESAKDVAENAYPFLGVLGINLENNFQEYKGLAKRLGTMDLTGTDFEDSRVSPKLFSIYLGDLPATETGYTITVNYTTEVNPYTKPLVIHDYVEGTNVVDLYADLGNGTYTKLGDAKSSYWLAKQPSEDSVIKNIKDYDPENRILTYRVELDPLNNLQVDSMAYQIHDSLDKCPDAMYIKDSFKLYIHGTAKEFGGNAQAWVYDPDAEHLAWSSNPNDFKNVASDDFWKRLYEYINSKFEYDGNIYKRLDLQVSNEESGDRNSYFYLTLTNDSWIGTEEAKFVPMTLEYQVQLPKETTEETRYIDNEVLFSAYYVENPSDIALIGASRTSFDTQNIMHKKLYQQPSIQNNYTAGFQIAINRYESKDLKEAKEITVKDTLSDTLKLIISSVKLEGKNKNDTSWNEIPSDGWKLVSEENTFEVTILTDTEKQSKENPVYEQYRLTYQTKVLGDPETVVHYKNSASIESLGITSETVEQNVFIQEISGSGSIINLELTLLKVDGHDMTQRLKDVSFELYTYSETDKWTKQDASLTTNSDGKIKLANGQHNVSLQYNTWYALKETEAKEGYLLAEPVYFYIPKTGSSAPEAPKKDLKNEPFSGGEAISSEGELVISNVTPGFTLEKRDAKTGAMIYDAGFTLYSDKECEKRIKNVQDSTSGRYTFDNLEVNKTYYLKETKIPNGYLDPKAVYEVKIAGNGTVTIQKLDENGTPVTDGSSEIQTNRGPNAVFIANNTPIGYELPNTGGIGTTLFTISGLIIMAGAACCGYRLRCRRRRRGEN